MALTISFSPRELERVALAAYAGKRLRVFLAIVNTETYNSSTAVATWEALEVVGNGYSSYKEIIDLGLYDGTDTRYELGGIDTAGGYIDAEFNATPGGVGFTYNRVVVVVQDESSSNLITYTELTSDVATVTTASSHGLTTGDEVVISGATDSTYNGVYVVTGTPTATSFTFDKIHADITSAISVGTVKTYADTAYPHSVLTEGPDITLAPGQVITYRIQIIVDD
jgi:hypothetical protein